MQTGAAAQDHPGMCTDSHSSPTSTFPHDLQAWHARGREGALLVQMLQVIQLMCSGSHDRRREDVKSIVR